MREHAQKLSPDGESRKKKDMSSSGSVFARPPGKRAQQAPSLTRSSRQPLRKNAAR